MRTSYILVALALSAVCGFAAARILDAAPAPVAGQQGQALPSGPANQGTQGAPASNYAENNTYNTYVDSGIDRGDSGYMGTWRDPETGDLNTTVIAPRQPAQQQQFGGMPIIVTPQISQNYPVPLQPYSPYYRPSNGPEYRPGNGPEYWSGGQQGHRPNHRPDYRPDRPNHRPDFRPDRPGYRPEHRPPNHGWQQPSWQEPSWQQPSWQDTQPSQPMRPAQQMPPGWRPPDNSRPWPHAPGYQPTPRNTAPAPLFNPGQAGGQR